MLAYGVLSLVHEIPGDLGCKLRAERSAHDRAQRAEERQSCDQYQTIEGTLPVRFGEFMDYSLRESPGLCVAWTAFAASTMVAHGTAAARRGRCAVEDPTGTVGSEIPIVQSRDGILEVAAVLQ